MLVTATDQEAEKLVETLLFFSGKNDANANFFLGNKVWHFPSRTGYKAQWLGKMEISARRLETLYALRAARSPILLVTSLLAILELLPPPDLLFRESDYLIPGEQIDLQRFRQRLIARGYSPVSLVEEYGDFSVRGDSRYLRTALQMAPAHGVFRR